MSFEVYFPNPFFSLVLLQVRWSLQLRRTLSKRTTRATSCSLWRARSRPNRSILRTTTAIKVKPGALFHDKCTSMCLPCELEMTSVLPLLPQATLLPLGNSVVIRLKVSPWNMPLHSNANITLGVNIDWSHLQYFTPLLSWKCHHDSNSLLLLLRLTCIFSLPKSLLHLSVHLLDFVAGVPKGLMLYGSVRKLNHRSVLAFILFGPF